MLMYSLPVDANLVLPRFGHFLNFFCQLFVVWRRAFSIVVTAQIYVAYGPGSRDLFVSLYCSRSAQQEMGTWIKAEAHRERN